MTLPHLWIAFTSCHDYYCNGQHVVGIYSTEEAAKVAHDLAVERESQVWEGKIVGYELDASPLYYKDTSH